MKIITVIRRFSAKSPSSLKEMLREALSKLMALPRGISKTPTLKDQTKYYSKGEIKELGYRLTHRAM
jgi:hypothetical protein